MTRRAMAACAAAGLLAPAGGSAGRGGAPEPELVAPGVVNTAMAEQSPALGADGRRLVFAAGVSFFGTFKAFHALVESRRDARGWSEPRVLELSGRYPDDLPFLCRDGRRLLFVSRRPLAGEDPASFHARRLWRAERSASGWSEPEPVPGAPARFAAVHGCSATDAGVLYCSLQERDGPPDLYRLEPRDGAYPEAERLPDGVSSDAMDVHPFVSPDETLLFFASRRPGGLGGFDLWLSRRGPGGWGPAARLGAPINGPVHDMTPALDPQGRFLYFSSSRGFGDSPRERALSFEEIAAALRSVTNGQPNLYRIGLAEALR